tara:strand:+ start:710 stop:934 length:225 start_codon:yes stop_codon:yes gene_type:complete
MQKIINGIAILSGVVSLAVVGSGVFIYVQKDAIIEGVKSNIKEQVLGGVTDALPGIVGESMPTLPEATGPALPF